jgi:hypothetical protein
MMTVVFLFACLGVGVLVLAAMIWGFWLGADLQPGGGRKKGD